MHLSAQLKRDIIEWDVLNWGEILHIWEPIILKLPKNANILAVGERNGGISLWLALLGYNVECTDRSGPSEQAHTLHNKYKVSDKITYYNLDIVNDNLPKGHYDLIILKSVLGGLKENYSDSSSRSSFSRQKAVLNINQALKPSGFLLAAENMRGALYLNYLRTLKQKEKKWHYFSPNEILDLYNIFPSVTTNYFGIFPTLFSFNPLNWFIYIINKYLLSWLPANTYYIAITSARKSP